MRCRACNIELSDSESTRKNPTSGLYEDMCNECLKTKHYEDKEALLLSLFAAARTPPRSTE